MSQRAECRMGHCRATLELAREGVAWEEHVEGVLTLHGGNREQRLTVSQPIAATILGPSSDGSPASIEYAQWEKLRLAPGQVVRTSFSLPVRWAMPLGDVGLIQCWISVGWQPIPRSLSAHFRVDPPAKFACVAEAAAEVSGLVQGSWSVIGAGDGAAVTLISARQGHPVFDRIKLSLYRSGDSVYGEMLVDLREQNVLRSLAREDLRKYPLRLPARDPEAARAFFLQRLRPFLDGGNDLPLPSKAPEPEAGSLPLPCEEVDHSGSDDTR
jgi:hypothetical protein